MRALARGKKTGCQMLWLLRWLVNPFWVVFCSRADAARQATLLWTLAAAVERQFPAVPLLEALADEAGGPWRFKVHGLAELISAGVSIPNAVEASSGILSADAVALIRVGSETGNLLGALHEAADLARRQSDAPAFKFQGAVLYLCLLMAALATAMLYVALNVIPKYKVILAGFDTPVPAETEALIWFTHGAGLLLPLLVPPLIVALWFVLALSLDLFGWGPAGGRPLRYASRFWPRLRAAHVLRCLGLAVGAGTPISTTLNALVAGHPDRMLRWRLAGVAAGVEAGDDCWQCLRAAGLLRWSETAILAAAQRAGNLDWALRGLAEGIERRLDYRYRLLLECVHPAMIAVAGAMVAGFCVSLFIPVVNVIEKLT